MPHPGQKAYEVQWCTHLPLDENGDGDLDRAVYQRRIVPTRGLARHWARKMLKVDAFGSVTITLVRWKDIHKDGRFSWEYSGECVHVDE